MVYYEDDKLIIRDMESADAQVFTDEFTAQGWHPDIAGYLSRLKDRSENKCIALTAVYERCPAGYVYVYMCANEGSFKDKGWPIIVDFNVLKKYQRRGIGNRLMDAAEQVASQYADNVCLGVGLCDSYGAAQRMYVKRGYIPDGSGVWYQDKQCVQYETHRGFVEPEDKDDFFVNGQASNQVLWEDILCFNWECIIATAQRGE
ncbi:GNAT family N-acetyltransferase [Eubacterium xylanophilum]|uniref:GNAT family N-acetyltransferase n=1 Tax=Eubacterium xylanophilum TaxID=39497 RepID=UPI0004BB9F7B|nr:GNAT family N-acetyltransferase [Eubacterium xylanophilum]